MGKRGFSAKLVVLIALPAALLDVLSGIYNAFVPIYLQAGNAAFSPRSASLTMGFGLGAALVGFWMTADNILGFALIPWAGAKSDRTRSRLGRRLPWILWTLPLVILGICLLPVMPTLIPQGSNGQLNRLVGQFAFFTIFCIVFYVGQLTQRTVLQALRQEMVEPKDRPKMESWYSFLLYAFSAVALTLGGGLYRKYGPLLFWVCAAVYLAAIALLFVFFREPSDIAKSAERQENGSFKQLATVYRNNDRDTNRSLSLMLASVFLVTLAGSAQANFATSWMVATLGINESKAAGVLSIYTIAAMLASLPAGLLASRKLGRKRVYVGGLAISAFSTLLLSVAPQFYVVGLALCGVGLSCYFVTQLPLITELCGDRGNLGAVVGVYNLAYFLGFLLGANIMGWVIQLTSYRSLFWVVTPILAASMVCALLVRTGAPKQALAAKAGDDRDA